jgi:predicted PurR-regulated permease PerM
MADSQASPYRPSPRTVARAALIALAVITIVALIIAAGSALTPFIFGLALAYLFMPIVNRLGKRMPRWVAILLVYAIGLVILIALVLFLVPPLVNQTVRLIANLARPDSLERLIGDALDWYHTNVPPALQSPLEQTLQRLTPSLQENLSTIAAGVGAFILRQLTQVFSLLSFLVGFLIVPIWLFYVLNDARKGRILINRQLSYRVRHDFWNVWGIIDHSLSAYIRGQLTLGLIIGVAVGIGLNIVDFIPGIEIDYILLLAIWAGVAELVPMIGAMLGAIPAVIVALFVGGPVSALVVLGLFVIVQLVENNYLVPRVIGQSIGVHPAILIVALVVFGQLFGLLGVILAAPITAIARDLYVYTYRRLSGKSPSDAIAHLPRFAEQPEAKASASPPAPAVATRDNPTS